MKFGKVLQQSIQMSSTDWEDSWVDYKRLKKIIKDCAQLTKDDKLSTGGAKLGPPPSSKLDNESIRKSEDEMNFFRTLRMEINKITEFFLKEQNSYTSQVGSIEAKFEALKSNPKTDAKTELMKSCVTLYKELLLLENFAVMNFCGISKILKKHDKWTGYATRHKFMHAILMKQPFATYCPLLSMINRLEQIFMQATGCTIEEHDSHTSADCCQSTLGFLDDTHDTDSDGHTHVHGDETTGDRERRKNTERSQDQVSGINDSAMNTRHFPVGGGSGNGDGDDQTVKDSNGDERERRDSGDNRVEMVDDPDSNRFPTRDEAVERVRRGSTSSEKAESVSLLRVQSLKNDAAQFRKLETLDESKQLSAEEEQAVAALGAMERSGGDISLCLYSSSAPTTEATADTSSTTATAVSTPLATTATAGVEALDLTSAGSSPVPLVNEPVPGASPPKRKIFASSCVAMPSTSAKRSKLGAMSVSTILN